MTEIDEKRFITILANLEDKDAVDLLRHLKFRADCQRIRDKIFRAVRCPLPPERRAAE